MRADPEDLVALLGAGGSDPVAALEAARRFGGDVPLPGTDTLGRWRVLAGVAERDVAAARAIEPHLDALAILAEAGVDPGGSTWGVFAAEGPDTRLTAGSDGTVTGLKPWCSLAERLDAALVTAWIDAETRGLFAVELARPEVTVTTVAWHARGLAEIASPPVRFDGAAATPVGEPGWYLRRPGFAWGGIGVAACWWGAARPLLTRLIEHGASSADSLVLARIGRAYRSMATAAESLGAAAIEIDRAGADPLSHDQESIRAHRVRGTVADAVRTVLSVCEDVLGPAPAAFDEEYARRTADLALYVAQYHRGRDDASLARAVARDPRAPELRAP